VLLYLVIPLFAACQGSLLTSIDRYGGVYVLCGDHLLVDICRNFLLESFALFLLCFCIRLLSIMRLPLVVLVIYIYMVWSSLLL
jgi:hypothetical protein